MKKILLSFFALTFVFSGASLSLAEEVDTIQSCDDVYSTSDLLVYLSEFDGDLNCALDPQIDQKSHYNIFPGENVEDVVEVSLDGVWYSLATLPYFQIITIDTTQGFVMGEFTFPQNFPNWVGDQVPTTKKSILLSITLHTECDSIINDTAALLEYLARGSGSSLVCESNPTPLATISIQDSITITQGSDLLSQLEVMFDGAPFSIAGLTTYAILNGFSSDVVGEFIAVVGAGKDDVSTIEEVAVTVVGETQEESSNNGGGGSSSGSRRPTGNTNNSGEVLGASDEAEVLRDSSVSCPVFSSFYRKGDTGEGVTHIQTFLNEHMNAGLVVDGMFGSATEQAVHAFQQKYWEQTIKPWTSVFSSRTTGRWYKTTSAWANTLSGCVSEPVFLEDVGKMHTPATI